MDNMECVLEVLIEGGVQTVILAVDCVLLSFTSHYLRKCCLTIKALTEVKAFETTKDFKGLYSDGSTNYPYVLIRGIVKPLNQTIKSNNNQNVDGVIQKLSLKEHFAARTGGGFWSNRERIINESFNTVPFAITNQNVAIEVLDPLNAEILDLDVIMDKFEPQALSFFDHIVGFFSGVRQKGLQTTEEMLRIGTLLTAVGELRDEGGELKVMPPQNNLPFFLTTSTKLNLIKKFEESKYCLKIVVFIFGSVAIYLSSKMIIKIMKRKRQLDADKKLKQQLEKTRKERRALSRDKNSKDIQLCIICSENPKEIVLLPCGHVSLCEDCSDKIKDLCPLCRTPIESRAAAFIV